MHPERSDPDHVAVLRVNTDARNVLCVFEPDVSPRLAGIGRLVDAVALLDVPAELGLARADVHDIGIGLTDLHRADGRAGNLPVGDRPPVHPSIGGLPQSTTRGSKVVLHGPRVAAGTRGGPAASGWTNIAPLQ